MLLQKLTFGTFNVHTEAVKDINGINQIYCLLSICAANGDDVIKLQETKREEIPGNVTDAYRAYFSGDCSGVKRRKG